MSAEATRDLTVALHERVIAPGGHRYGLVIGIEAYADPRLNLGCARADARAVYELMVDAECGLFPPGNVQLLLDEQATTEAIWRALAHLLKQACQNDTVWIYYAGHAAAQADKVYWVTHDADVDDLFATALDRDRIASVLAQLPAKRVVLLLDCCHAAATAAQRNPTRAVLTGKDLFGRFEGQGTITLAASDGKQKSVELFDEGHGAFTYYLVKGLRGEADADGDGVVTADELWAYLRGKVEDASRRAGNAQTPVLMGSMTHDVALTLNPASRASKLRLAAHVERLVGLRADQLTTDEARFCMDALHGPSETALLKALEAAAGGQLDPALLKAVVRGAMRDGIPPVVPPRRPALRNMALLLTGAAVLAVAGVVGAVLLSNRVAPPPARPDSIVAVTTATSAVPSAEPTTSSPREERQDGPGIGAGAAASAPVKVPPRQKSSCGCPPGDLMCAMKCAAAAPSGSAGSGGDSTGFNRSAADSALKAAASAAQGCKTPDGPTGSGMVKVTFDPSGKVSWANTDGRPPFAGTAVGACVAAAFMGAQVPPFDGKPVVVPASFRIR